MSHTRNKSLGTIVIVVITLSAPAAAHGATIILDLIHLSSWDATFTTEFLGNPLQDDPFSIDPTDVHIFGLRMFLFGMAPNEDFRSVQVDMVMGPGFSPEDFGGFGAYFPTALMFDPPGAEPPGDIWSTNTDAGTPSDLQEITVLLDNIAAAAALQPGEPGPLELGQFAVNFDPAGWRFNTTVGIAPNGDSPATVWDNGAVMPAELVAPSVPGPPEPASLALLGLGSVILLRRRRV